MGMDSTEFSRSLAADHLMKEEQKRRVAKAAQDAAKPAGKAEMALTVIGFAGAVLAALFDS